MKFKSLWYNEEEKTIRGSFIQVVITAIYLVLIVLGTFMNWIGTNLRNIESLLIGFYLVSFGVWTGKKSVEFIKKSGLDSVLSKHGLDLSNLSEAGEVIRSRKTNDTTIRVGAEDLEQRLREREAAI